MATVVRTHGSTPQVVGAKMIVGDDERGRIAGTLGGGCVEADAILAAREVITAGGHSLRAYELTEDLAWNTGLVCGGTMWILAERAEDALACGGPDALAETIRAASGGPPVAFVSLLVRQATKRLDFGGRVFVRADGRMIGTLGDTALDARASAAAVEQMRHGTPRLVAVDDTQDLLVDPIVSRPRLVIAGGGHVARAIARQAQLIEFDVTILEDRPEFSDPSRFDGGEVITGDVPASIASYDFGWNSWLVIATRGHKLDADCVLAAAKTSVRYIGLLGSRRKTILVNEMLREAGIADDRIAVIHAPVGLDLGGRTPAEIALAVLSEITRIRYSGSGESLSRSGPRR